MFSMRIPHTGEFYEQVIKFAPFAFFATFGFTAESMEHTEFLSNKSGNHDDAFQHTLIAWYRNSLSSI